MDNSHQGSTSPGWDVSHRPNVTCCRQYGSSLPLERDWITPGCTCSSLTGLNVQSLGVVDSQGSILSTQLLGLPRGSREYWGSR